jgi:hypothetical protein
MALCSHAAGREARYSRYDCGSDGIFEGTPSMSSQCTSKGMLCFAITGITFRKSASVTLGNSSIPECVRKALNPNTPASIKPSISFSLPGTMPPQNPQLACNWSFAAASFRWKASALVVTGVEFSGISTSVVIPPVIAALVAVSNPSQPVRPGSLIWTCGSIKPGINALSPASTSSQSASAGRKSTIPAMTPFLIRTIAGFTIPGVTM